MSQELVTNLIYCGDNLKVLAKFPDNSVDLIYADPPFFSNRNYEVIWGNGAELAVFEDRWKGGIHVYIEWMKERLHQCWRVLKETGSIYLHCDWHAVHRLRVMMDDIFEAKNFQNEIIWHYGLGGSSPKRWSKKHDNILFYAKSETWTFNPIMVPATSQRMKGQMKKADDVWDIPTINNMAKERMGYPTQKPEALLERVIQGSSNPGDIVLDPFCGCGTTLVVAHREKRSWIGVDVSPIACAKMKERLSGIGAGNVQIIGAPKTILELKALKPAEFQDWVINRIGGTHSPKKVHDMGIDGYTFFERHPIQVKQQERVGRNTVDNFETAVKRAKQTTGYIVAFSFTKTAYEEAARTKQEDGLELFLVRVDEIDEYF